MLDSRSHNHNGRVQGGSNADNVLADAYVKGMRGGHTTISILRIRRGVRRREGVLCLIG
jgi:hypothetical protein